MRRSARSDRRLCYFAVRRPVWRSDIGGLFFRFIPIVQSVLYKINRSAARHALFVAHAKSARWQLAFHLLVVAGSTRTELPVILSSDLLFKTLGAPG